jgi:hypothetical protein
MALALETYRGDDFIRTIEFTEDNEPLSIVGWVVYFTVKRNPDDTDDDAIIKKDITEHSDPSGGITKITVPKSETNYLGEFYCDIRVKNADGIVKTMDKGSIKFIRDISRRASA